MRLSDLIYERHCAVCDAKIDKGSVCFGCDFNLASLAKPSERIVTNGNNSVLCKYAFEYRGEKVKNLIFSLKGKADSELVQYCAGIYFDLCKDFLLQNKTVYVTHIPRNFGNFNKYGYDQSKRCAKELARISGEFTYKDMFSRKISSTVQKKLTIDERIVNTYGKFSLRKRKLGKTVPDVIIVVDDMITSGSSMLAVNELLYDHYGDNVEISGVFLVSNN